jgi:outer membrane scaffolding protein for murein synthesis (MipA/OmpV family)
VLFALLVPLSLQAQDILLGAGARNRPVYDGSGEQTTDLIPVVRYYGRPWFARTTQGLLEGGARVALNPGLDGGVQLAYEQGPRDGDPGASLGLHMELDTTIGPVPLNLLARTRTHLDSDRGSQADVRATIGLYGSRGLQLGVFGQGTWANEKHTEAYYGVRHAGLLFTSVGILGSYDLARRWVAVASAELRRLASEPSRSAFVQDRTNYYFSAGLAYRF